MNNPLIQGVVFLLSAFIVVVVSIAAGVLLGLFCPAFIEFQVHHPICSSIILAAIGVGGLYVVMNYYSFRRVKLTRKELKKLAEDLKKDLKRDKSE